MNHLPPPKRPFTRQEVVTLGLVAGAALVAIGWYVAGLAGLFR